MIADDGFVMTCRTESRLAEIEKRRTREANASLEEEKLNAEEKARWALEKETRRIAKSQTSMSSMRTGPVPSRGVPSLRSVSSPASTSTQMGTASGSDTPATSVDDSATSAGASPMPTSVEAHSTPAQAT